MLLQAPHRLQCKYTDNWLSAVDLTAAVTVLTCTEKYALHSVRSLGFYHTTYVCDCRAWQAWDARHIVMQSFVASLLN